MNNVDNAILELTRCTKELKFPGVQIGSHIESKNLDDPSFDPLWKVSTAASTAALCSTALYNNSCFVWFVWFEISDKCDLCDDLSITVTT